MKKEKLILAAVALIAGTSSLFAFKAHHRSGGKTLFTVTTGQCVSKPCWTAAGVTNPCPAVTGGYRTVLTVNNVQFCTTVHPGTTVF